MDAHIQFNKNQSLTIAALRDTRQPKLLSVELRLNQSEKLAEAYT